MGRAAIVMALALAAGCASHPETPDNGLVCRTYAGQGSKQEVLAKGKVATVLGTSNGPSGEHEGFLLQLTGDCDLLVRIETNVSITGAVPLSRGEEVIVKGEYEYTALGGVIHWTHHDPSGRHIDGYVQAGGKIYA
jgi:Protein of unknown function (DUF3465)